MMLTWVTCSAPDSSSSSSQGRHTSQPLYFWQWEKSIHWSWMADTGYHLSISLAPKWRMEHAWQVLLNMTWCYHKVRWQQETTQGGSPERFYSEAKCHGLWSHLSKGGVYSEVNCPEGGGGGGGGYFLPWRKLPPTSSCGRSTDYRNIYPHYASTRCWHACIILWYSSNANHSLCAVWHNKAIKLCIPHVYHWM